MKKWIKVNPLSSDQYSVNKNIRLKISMLRSDLCDYSDAYIVAKWKINLLASVSNENDKAETNDVFKNNTPFISCISKINSTVI